MKVKFKNGRNDSVLTIIDGKVSFPDRNWSKTHHLPKEGEMWEVEISGSNAKGSVNFLKPVKSPEEIKAALKESIRLQKLEMDTKRKKIAEKIDKAWEEIQAWNVPEPKKSELVNLNTLKDFEYSITEYKLIDTEWEGDGMRSGDNIRRDTYYVYKASPWVKDVKVNGSIFPIHQEISGTMLLHKPEIGEVINVPASKAIVGYNQHQERRKAENEPYKIWSWYNSIKTLARKEENNGIFIPVESSDGYPELLKLNLDNPFELDYPISGFSDWDSYQQFMNEEGGF